MVGTIRANETSYVPGEFERLENDECISQYARQFLTNRSDLFLVVSSEANDTYAIEVGTWNSPKAHSPNGWMCQGKPESCDAASLKAESEDWEVFDSLNIKATEPMTINYCLSKPVKESCRLIMNVPPMVIVVGCNVLKLIGLGLSWIFLEKEPLLTLGGK